VRAGAPAAPPTSANGIREEIADFGLTAERAGQLAAALEAEGHLVDAIAAWTAANRLRRDHQIERRLARLRAAAMACCDRSLPPPDWPPHIPTDAPGAKDWPPEIAPGELTPGVLRNGILRHGSVLVRGLVSPRRAARLRAAIDQAFGAYDASHENHASDETRTWFDPLEKLADGEAQRTWNRMNQSLFTADSPRALFQVLETFYELGIDRLLTMYFGERPALSVEKTTLRRVDPARLAWAKRTESETVNASGWHQDGAFLGPGIRTVDLWIALSDCGVTAPGMDIVPKRLDHLVRSGGPGAGFEWTVSETALARELAHVPIWSPTFAAGDALFIDHHTLHRTAVTPSMTGVRYAIENWFFAPSVYPESGSTPIVV
jgi:hypothetical protein